MKSFAFRFAAGAAACAVAVCLQPALADNAHATLTDVRSADDICAPTDDPCILSESAEIFADIDFGTRAFQVTGAGTIDIGGRAIAIRAGRITADAGASPAIDMRPSGNEFSAGTLFLVSSRRCSGDQSLVCQRATQCSFGMCMNGQCLGNVDLGCSSDVDCDFGTCSIGDGSVTIDGNIRGNGEDPAFLDITAAGDVAMNGNVDLQGTTIDSDGGSIGIESAFGNVTITDKFNLTSGGDSEGGAVDIVAGGTVTISGNIDCDGGDFDGGQIDVLADGDIDISGAVTATSVSGEGWGGVITLDASGDINISSTADLRANGHESFDNSGGSGGEHSFSALGSINVEDGAVIEALGARPDGDGGAIFLDAEDMLTVTGRVTSKALGIDGAGETLALEGCMVNIRNGARIEMAGDIGEIAIEGRGLIVIESGTTFVAENESEIIVDYGDMGFEPVLLGSFDPAPVVSFNPGLGDCGVCGDGVINQNGLETCDDGGFVSGDGCNAECQDEVCVAETPGYPDVAVCDDGLDCTTDTCAPGDGCSHVVECDDEIECTLDGCSVAGQCINVPEDSLCDDSNVCTVARCSRTDGCVQDPVNGACDDGLDCTINDACAAGTCSGFDTCGANFFCSPTLNECVPDGFVTTTTSSTTSTTLGGGGNCGDGIVQAGEECDAGGAVFEGGDSCRTDCTLVACGDTDDSGAITAGDALYILRNAIGLLPCDSCLCDVDSSGGGSTAGDALRALRNAVGLPEQLVCPVCPM